MGTGESWPERGSRLSREKAAWGITINRGCQDVRDRVKEGLSEKTPSGGDLDEPIIPLCLLNHVSGHPCHVHHRASIPIIQHGLNHLKQRDVHPSTPQIILPFLKTDPFKLFPSELGQSIHESMFEVITILKHLDQF